MDRPSAGGLGALAGLVLGGGPRSNRKLRWLMVAAIGALLLPMPEAEVARLVPFQAELGAIEPVAIGLVALTTPEAPVRIAATSLVGVVITLTLAVLLLQILRNLWLCHAASPVHSIGNVRVVVAPVRSPRTLWLGRHWILLDAKTAAVRAERDLAVRHEIQHIRHGDTLWAWFVALLVALCAPNPFAWLLARNLSELDEHGVDRALVQDRAVSARAYGHLLLHTATGGPNVLALAAGLSPKTPLHRRLQMLHSTRPTRILPWLVASLLLGGVALARPSLPLSSDLGATIEATNHDGIVVPDHEVVQAAYERFTRGKGKAFLAKALSRRDEHRAFILERLEQAGLPAQLEAVALIESGYDDQLLMGDATSIKGPRGGGLWMFIPSTARQYGLTVSPTLDERLDRRLETEAAIALLTDLHDEFDDWGLALAGYNQGAGAVHRAIATHETRDVSTLVEKGALRRYVPMVWAAMLILEEQG